MLSTAFVLDPFQVEAITAVERGESVLVAAPTGSGKTVIAIEAIASALARGERAIYTTPIKALSNQKHRELGERFGRTRAGLLTGDRSVNPRGDVVVMTTEVLRALLVDPTALLDGVTTVVLDEFHYIQDVERGAVWEEIVMAAPATMTLICLSATLSDAPRLHRWLDDIHEPTTLVVSEQRPVPLHHHYAIGNLQGAPPLIMPMFIDGRPNEAALVHDGVRRTLRGEGLRERDRKRPVTPRREALVAHLTNQDLLPAIWFVLSRAACDRAATELTSAGVSLNNASEASMARDIADATLASFSAGELRAIDTQQWRHWLQCGIAVHHSGHLPRQREAIEQAFAAGAVKLVFATETLAVGVNLPARTVVIDTVMRPDGQGRQKISAPEFTQLAGRAGRRGMDSAGHVFVPWSPEASLYEVAELAAGRPLPLESRMQWTPALVAGVAHRFDRTAATVYAQRSLAAHLARDHAAVLRTQLADRRAAHAELVRAAPAIERAVDQHQTSASIREEIDLTHIAVADVIVDPGRSSPSPLLVVEIRKGRRGEPTLKTAGADARLSTVTRASLRRTPVVVAKLDATTWDPHERGQAQRWAHELQRLELPVFDHIPPPPPRQPRQATPQARRAAIEAEIETLEDDLMYAERAVTASIDVMVRLLRQRGHLDGFVPTDSGHLLRRIYHPQGLLVAECLNAGLFDELAPETLAGALAGFRAAVSRNAIGAGPNPPKPVAQTLARATEIADDLNRAETELGLPPTPGPDTSTARAMFRWASGDPLDHALADTELLPGDFVREIRQVIELIDQVAAAAPWIAPTAQAALTTIDRGIAKVDD